MNLAQMPVICTAKAMLGCMAGLSCAEHSLGSRMLGCWHKTPLPELRTIPAVCIVCSQEAAASCFTQPCTTKLDAREALQHPARLDPPSSTS